MSNAVKRQHWIPCCYLQFFAINGEINGRNSSVYFSDGQYCKRSSVKNLGVAKYTYSKTNPSIDAIFHDMEADYPRIVRKIISGETLSLKDKVGLILTVFDFSHRNISIENRSDAERASVYDRISRRFIHDLIDQAEIDAHDMQGLSDFINLRWGLKILKLENKKEKFISSDNPTIVFFEPTHNKNALAILPIHPEFAIAVHDKHFVEVISSIISDNELGILNGLQCKYCIRHIIADHNISIDQSDFSKIQNIMQRPKPERWADNNNWLTGYISLENPLLKNFDFFKLCQFRN